MVKNKCIWIVLFGLSIFTFAGCQSTSQKEAVTPENVVSEELHQAQCDLLAEANETLAVINQKVRDLNDKIKAKEGKLTDAQNSALDDFEARQTSINKRMHEIKSIKEADWDAFKTSFEKDLQEVRKSIEDILKSF